VIEIYFSPLPSSLSPSELRDAAYRLLGYAIRERFGLVPGTYTIERGKMGKPYIERDGVYFNLTHTDGLAAAAVGEVPVGIDAELDRPLSAAMRGRWLCGCGEDDGILEWTQRESYGKFTGEGFVFKEPKRPHKYAVNRIGRYIVTLCTSPDAVIAEKLNEIKLP